jgi:hypothetical protein
MVALRLDDKLQMPHYEFDDERVRYERRFAPFASLITPPIMHYQEFIEMTTNSKEPQTSVHYYLAGADLFHQARSFLEGLPFLDTEVKIKYQMDLICGFSSRKLNLFERGATESPNGNISLVVFEFGLSGFRKYSSWKNQFVIFRSC